MTHLRKIRNTQLRRARPPLAKGAGHIGPSPELRGRPLRLMAPHYTAETPPTCTGGCPQRLIAPRGHHTRVREGTPGDRRPWASSTCRSRAMGTIGADRSWVARATTPGPQPHGRARLGLEASRFPHLWGGGPGHAHRLPRAWSFGAP